MKSLKVIIIFVGILGIAYMKKSYLDPKILREPAPVVEKFPTKKDWESFLIGVNELNDIWLTGDYPYLEDMSCKKFSWSKVKSIVSADYLKCNPVVMNCFIKELARLRDSEFEFDLNENEVSSFFINPDMKYDQGDALIDIMINKDFTRRISLSSQCREVYLPEGEKIYSPLNFELNISNVEREESKAWNHDKRIFIDKFQVSYLDLYLQDPLKYEKEVNSVGEKLFRPITSFNKEEMRNFCANSGKKVLTAKLYDAMVMEGKNFKSLLTRDSTSNCKDFYYRDCITNNEKVTYWSTDNVSEIGSYDIRGGVLEYVENSEQPFFNTIASSMYFPYKSYWHNLTHRFHWNGLGHEDLNFKFTSSITGENLEGISSDKIKIGFRCYREI